MISQRMQKFAGGNSAVRAMFEEGKRLAALYGKENIYDFSIGNPNFPAPAQVNETIIQLAQTEESTQLHGYPANAGYPEVRRAVAQDLERRYGVDYDENSIVMTVGAAGGINCALQTLLDPDDEVLVFAPYFLEYGNYVSNWNGILKAIPATPPDFLPNIEKLCAAVTEKTKALILNNPNNPTGVIYDKRTLEAIAATLDAKQKEYGHPIYILSDEPYRDLAYDGVAVTHIPTVYPNTLVIYSWSKSLSLPGERIGYVAIPKAAEDAAAIFEALSISNRIIGFVNAPSLQQKVVAQCLTCQTDLSGYDKNRQALYRGLTDIGFSCLYPQGAFYLWMKTPIQDDVAFAEAAKKHRILLVPGKSFAGPGYVRIAYCVSYEQIERSLPAFADLYAEVAGK